ncbi:MAG: hypothetical protein JO235_23580 [Chroococcidiopsidaceae cyanobacterium CP_BM_RX_35]|nr:hypothetical protein [Chroococcidiopsidaceae cyanobacterium CP_BM_RX_35]
MALLFWDSDFASIFKLPPKVFMVDAIAALITLITLVSLFGSVMGIWLTVLVYGKLTTMDSELRLLTVENDWGKIRLDLFAIRCGVHSTVANWYLGRKARQFNGIRQIDEWGDIVFLFGEAKRKFLLDQF